mgnify:CR=1 FL=1
MPELNKQTNKTPVLGRCKACSYMGKPAFDGKCPQCGENISLITGNNDNGPAKQAADQICPNCHIQIPYGHGFCPSCGQVTTKNESLESHMNTCGYCYNTLGESEDSCSRCGWTMETAPSGGETAQSRAPVSYSQGGSTGDIGISATCPGCGEMLVIGQQGKLEHPKSTKLPESCQNCGYSGIEYDEGWSNFVTMEDAQQAAVLVSQAMLSEDEEDVNRIASEIVWGSVAPRTSSYANYESEDDEPDFDSYDDEDDEDDDDEEYDYEDYESED